MILEKTGAMLTNISYNAVSSLERLAALVKRPQYLLVQVTSRCNAKCPFCCNPSVREMPMPELTPEQAGKIAANLGHLFHLAVTGGEPFLRDDLIQWIDAFCQKARVQSVTIGTNGSMPDHIVQTLEILTARHTRTIFTLLLSVDAYGPRHDTVRNLSGLYKLVKKSYDAAITVRRAHPTAIRLILASVLSAANEEFFLQDLELLHKDFPDVDSHEVNLVRPNQDNPGRRDVAVDIYRKSLEWVSRNRSGGNFYHNIHQALFERTNDLTLQAAMGQTPGIACSAGRGFATINSSGQVILCEEKPNYVLGDLQNYDWDLRALLSDPEIARKATLLRKECFCRSDCVIRFNLTHTPSQYPALALALAKIIRHKSGKIR
jgi:MoaA/NifB/PqqE/SkfB family radical SAM enzyme